MLVHASASPRFARREARFGPLTLIVLAALAAAIAGCGGSAPGPLVEGQAAGGLELQGDPVVVYDAPSGKTTVVLELLLRDAAGNSVDPGSATFRRLVNGRAADVESVPDFQDTKLASNLRLGMVLDASYSMTTWKPPAFEPMKQAALDTVTSVRKRFAANSTGAFTTDLSFFQDQYLCSPSAPAMPDAAVLEIPSPKPGDSTKLYAAAASMVDRMKAAYDALPNPSSSDHFAVVLFTDGYDNYSWHDDAAAPAKSYPATGGAFDCAGMRKTALVDLQARLRAFPQLRMHVIGLGNTISSNELAGIAQAGRGRFVSNPDPSQVATLFAAISRELTTVRRDGITMPLPPGDYEYVEEATVNGQVSRIRFRFHAGDDKAGVKAGTLVLQ